MILTALALLFLAPVGPVSDSSAQTVYEYRLTPTLGQVGGTTRFVLEFPYETPTGRIGQGRSELVFPLDFDEIGAAFEFWVMQSDLPVWKAELKIGWSISDPRSDMTDRDWINPGFGDLEFSSTNSTVEGSMKRIGLGVTRLISARRAGGHWELEGYLGFDYQHIKQRMTDLRGWQFDIRQVAQLISPDQISSLTKYTFNEQIAAGTYEVSFFRPEIGLMPRFVSGPLSIQLKGAISPLLRVSDLDDHLLRGFQIKTSGRGFGYLGRVRIGYHIGSDPRRGAILVLEGQMSGASADVSGIREQYAYNPGFDPDDPSDDIPRGTVWPEDHHISSTQYRIRLMLGLRL